MTTERIDVLAVMAREETMRRRNANRELARGNGDKWDQFWKRAEHIKEARAAVAELIEAVRLYRHARFLNAKSEHGDRAAIARELGLDEYSGLLTIQCEAFDRVETALARVGGA